MVIVITGTPGTGKTTIAQILAKKLKLEMIPVKKIVERNRGMYEFKKQSGEKVVDLDKLRKKLMDEIKKIKGRSIIIENHLLCDMKLPAKWVFVLRCKPEVLEKRMERRAYSTAKIQENILAEMLDYCTQKARKNYKGKARIVELDTSRRNKKSTVTQMIQIINGTTKKGDKVDYSKQLRKWTLTKKDL